jgi:hypothetical protein
LRDGSFNDWDSTESHLQRTIYWDLSSIDTNANRLDIAIGTNERYASSNDYLWGNWLRNEDNVNFNFENPDLRFIYDDPPAITDSITGISFINLKENTRNYLVVLRTSGDMEIRKNENSFIQINNPSTVSGVYGKNPVVGKFTTDTLQDLAIISPTGLRVFKGTGGTNPTLEEVFVIQNYTFKKIYLAQVNKHYGPYAIINNETNDRDDIIAHYSNSIYIFNNNNDNTTNSSPNTTISFSEYLSDFKVADLNNDGYNDIIAITQYEAGFTTYGRILIFLNVNGTINSTPVYNNGDIRYPNSIETADFNKDGWNDFIIDRGNDTLSLFLNQKNSSLFSNTQTEGFRYADAPGPFLINPMFARKIVAVDLYNKGGIGVIFSGWNSGGPLEEFESIIRINATTIDAVPAPAYVFKSVEVVNGTHHPKLLLFNRGDRDFLKYKIYKRSGFTNWVYALIDSTTSDHYIDTVETLDTTGGIGVTPPPNLKYYVRTEDNSHQLSVNSDTADFLGLICPTCPTEPYEGGGDNRGMVSNTNGDLTPVEFAISNFPNPFNPVTKIEYSIPVSGDVRISIYNSLGQMIKQIVNEFKEIGNYSVQFDGSSFASGIYYYRMETGSYSQVKKMILLK